MIVRRTALGLLAGGLIPGAGLTVTGLTAASGAASDEITTVAPSGDTSGAADEQAISAALAAEQAVQLVPGTYYLDAGLTVNTMLAGCGPATRLIPVGFTGPIVTMGSRSMLSNLQLYGGSTTTADNPATDGISLSAGASQVFVDNILAYYLNGWILNPQPIESATHMSVVGIRGLGNAGGIQLYAASGVTAQVALTDIDIQQCQVDAALQLENVYDISVRGLNCAVSGSAEVATVRLVGDVATALFSDVDAGVYPAPESVYTPVLKLEASGSGEAPSDISFTGCTFQQGGAGIEVDDSSSNLRFTGVMAKTNLGNGWLFSGDGTFISLNGCGGYANNASGGTAADVSVTGTGHVGIFGFGYGSADVTYALEVPAANHVTNDNATYPGGGQVSGTPQGWLFHINLVDIVPCGPVPVQGPELREELVDE
jgi:hypothetical protein